jgi:hypothetical protein
MGMGKKVEKPDPARPAPAGRCPHGDALRVPRGEFTLCAVCDWTDGGKHGPPARDGLEEA